MKQKYIGASPLVGSLLIPLNRRFTSGYPYRIRSGFFNTSCFYVDPLTQAFAGEPKRSLLMRKEMLILYYTDRYDFNTPC